ncbi:ABC transporter ATP-binding protein [bacterium]|nr:ABC transporter ATP-binding protein [bacterium]
MLTLGKSICQNTTMQEKIDVKTEPLSAVKKEAKRLFWGFFWTYKKQYLLGVLSLAIVDFIDVLPPLIIRQTIDAIEGKTGFSVLLNLALIYLVSTLIQAVFRFYWRKFFLGTSHLVGYDLRRRLFEHLQTLSFSYFNQQKTGDLMSRVTNDVDEVRQMYGIGFLLIMDAFFYFSMVPFLMIWMSPSLAFYVILPTPIIPIFVTKVGEIIHDRFKTVQETLAQLSAKTQENISGIRVVKAFARENIEIDSFNKTNRTYVSDNLKLAKIQAGFNPSLELAMGIGIFLILVLGGRQVLDGKISIGSFVAFQAYLLKMVWPMTAVGWTINLYQRGMASLFRCAEVLSVNPDIFDSPKAIHKSQFNGSIQVTNLTFAFGQASQPVLRNLSFEVPAGKTLGIVGPVGSGKSTLLSLFMRFFDPPDGTIFIDGIDIKNLSLCSLRQTIGFVPQDTFLFSETVFENLALGLKDKGDFEKITECAKRAQILNEIEALPEGKGMQTILGERGINLSGGQKQRLSLARALAKDPKIIILDDAMSAVDTNTEEQILSGLKVFLQGRTAIIVSHRLTSIQHADLILVIDKGTILERGSHAELLALNGNYAKLWEIQRLKSELDEA